MRRTTIDLKITTRNKLKKFKLVDSESFDGLLNRLLDELEELRKKK